MIEFTNLYMFIITSFLLCLAPGPDNIYVLTQGITQGKKAALITTLGLCTGLIIHTTAAVLGISVIFKTSQLVFDIVKYLGVLYLLYIAYQIYKHRNDSLNLNTNKENIKLKKLYVKGFFMNILNPKISIFFLSFLPQFVEVKNGNVELQMMIFGIIFMIMTIFVFGMIGISANLLGKNIRKNPKILKYMNVLTSFLLVGLGIKLALTQR